LHGRISTSDDEVKDEMHKWLQSQPKYFVADGIRRLVNRYATCVVKRG